MADIYRYTFKSNKSKWEYQIDFNVPSTSLFPTEPTIETLPLGCLSIGKTKFAFDKYPLGICSAPNLLITIDLSRVSQNFKDAIFAEPLDIDGIKYYLTVNFSIKFYSESITTYFEPYFTGCLKADIEDDYSIDPHEIELDFTHIDKCALDNITMVNILSYGLTDTIPSIPIWYYDFTTYKYYYFTQLEHDATIADYGAIFGRLSGSLCSYKQICTRTAWTSTVGAITIPNQLVFPPAVKYYKPVSDPTYPNIVPTNKAQYFYGDLCETHKVIALTYNSDGELNGGLFYEPSTIYKDPISDHKESLLNYKTAWDFLQEHYKENLNTVSFKNNQLTPYNLAVSIDDAGVSESMFINLDKYSGLATPKIKRKSEVMKKVSVEPVEVIGNDLSKFEINDGASENGSGLSLSLTMPNLAPNGELVQIVDFVNKNMLTNDIKYRAIYTDGVAPLSDQYVMASPFKKYYLFNNKIKSYDFSDIEDWDLLHLKTDYLTSTDPNMFAAGITQIQTMAMQYTAKTLKEVFDNPNQCKLNIELDLTYELDITDSNKLRWWQSFAIAKFNLVAAYGYTELANLPQYYAFTSVEIDWNKETANCELLSFNIGY